MATETETWEVSSATADDILNEMSDSWSELFSAELKRLNISFDSQLLFIIYDGINPCTVITRGLLISADTDGTYYGIYRDGEKIGEVHYV
jgi:hypothetical protein